MDALLQVQNLSIGFKVFEGLLRVLEDIRLAIEKGEKVGLVGETGCGKTTTVKSILRVLPQPPAVVFGGRILFHEEDVLRMNKREMRKRLRPFVSAIFQDPLQALNPVFTVGTQLIDIVHDWATINGKRIAKREAFQQCVEALASTGMPDPERIMSCYPVQLSGGMRQRVCIAAALLRPVELLLADEPTTNLDVTIQDQILRELHELAKEKRLSILFITHSLGVVMDLTEHVYIMYAGTIVEEGKPGELFAKPLHPYTKALLKSVPKLTGEGISEGIPGRIPSYLNPPPGCRFNPRCEEAVDICRQRRPSLVELNAVRSVACHLFGSSNV